jgi:hypothetical protein
MTEQERETWSWYARWAVIARAFAIAEREGLRAGPQRLRRARQILDPDATERMLAALIAHLERRQAAGERDVFAPPGLVDIVGPALAARIIDAGLVDGAIAKER